MYLREKYPLPSQTITGYFPWPSGSLGDLRPMYITIGSFSDQRSPVTLQLLVLHVIMV